MKYIFKRKKRMECLHLMNTHLIHGFVTSVFKQLFLKILKTEKIKNKKIMSDYGVRLMLTLMNWELLPPPQFV